MTDAQARVNAAEALAEAHIALLLLREQDVAARIAECPTLLADLELESERLAYVLQSMPGSYVDGLVTNLKKALDAISILPASRYRTFREWEARTAHLARMRTRLFELSEAKRLFIDLGVYWRWLYHDCEGPGSLPGGEQLIRNREIEVATALEQGKEPDFITFQSFLAEKRAAFQRSYSGSNFCDLSLSKPANANAPSTARRRSGVV